MGTRLPMLESMMKTDRLHACLDGEVPRDDLSLAERAELEAMERMLDSAIDLSRSVPVIDLRGEVMDRIADVALPIAFTARSIAGLRAVWSWFWAPRRFSFQLRPVLAFTIALLVLLPLSLRRDAGPEGRAPADSTRELRTVHVQFRLDMAGARTVSLAGSFSGWDPIVELRESSPGVWTAVVPLTPGVHDYLFLVDGAEWVPDPAARPVKDDFGGMNSRILLTTSSFTT
jgi:hypothetical protein